MLRVRFGVSKALEPFKPDPESDARKVRKLKGRRVVTFTFPPPTRLRDGSIDPTGWTIEKQLAFVTSEAPARWEGKPDWVEADDPGLQSVLASQYDCREGKPRDWKPEA